MTPEYKRQFYLAKNMCYRLRYGYNAFAFNYSERLSIWTEAQYIEKTKEALIECGVLIIKGHRLK
jgi:hypothetical protein